MSVNEPAENESLKLTRKVKKKYPKKTALDIVQLRLFFLNSVACKFNPEFHIFQQFFLWNLKVNWLKPMDKIPENCTIFL